MPRKGLKTWAARSCAAAIALVLFAAWLAAGEPRFTFAVIGDRTGGAREGVFEGVIAEVAFFDPDFMITVGDHIQGYSMEKDEIERQWDEFEAIMDGSGLKYYLTPGNHDIWDQQSESVFKDRAGYTDKAFKIDNTRFIIFDVSRNYGPEDFTEDQVKWLTKELEKSGDAAHTLVFLHKPFWCEDFSFGRESWLHNLFLEHGVTAVFSGHYHRYFYTERDGIRYYGVGSSLMSNDGSVGTNTDFTADVVRILVKHKWVDMAKVGRAPCDNPELADSEVDKGVAGDNQDERS